MMYVLLYLALSRILFFIIAITYIPDSFFKSLFILTGIIPLFADLLVYPSIIIYYLEDNFDIKIFY